MQICSFWRPKGDYVTNMVNIQTQPNGCNCGVFAIANATELAFGKDPLLCRYDAEVMRIHFLQCLENRKMEHFPLKRPRKIPIGNHMKNTYKVKVYCICHMPNNFQKAMVRCDRYRKWFHKECDCR